jgi:hypothetical protein
VVVTGEAVAGVAVDLVGEPARPEVTRTTFLLRFADGDLAGQEVYVRRPTAAGKIDLAHAAGRPDPDEVATIPEAADRIYRIFRAFAGALQRWTLTDGGEPVPPTLEGLLGQDFGHAVEMAYAWLDAVNTNAEPAAGRVALEAELQIPVEALN